MSTVEEFILEGQLNLDVVKLELQLATICLNALAEGGKAESGHVALDVIDEVHFLGVQVPILSLELLVVKAYIGCSDDEVDDIGLVFGVDVVSLGDLNKLRLEVYI